MKPLIVYYSFSGNTKTLAEDIALLTDGDLLELLPDPPYSFSSNTAVKEIRNEIERGYCPKLNDYKINIAGYDFIFIGSPNWLKTFAPPIRTFIRDADLKGKTIIPFCTHGGGGFGRMIEDYSELLNESDILSGISVGSSYDFNHLKILVDKVYNPTGG